MKRRISILSVAALSVVFGWFGAQSARAGNCDISDLQQLLESKLDLSGGHVIDTGEDIIEIKIVDLPAGHADKTKFCLHATSDITWWKGMNVCDRAGRLVTMREVQDRAKVSCSEPLTTRSTFPGSNNEAGPIRIRLDKAKQLGVHTPKYVVPRDGESLRGKEVLITWSKDSK